MFSSATFHPLLRATVSQMMHINCLQWNKSVHSLAAFGDDKIEARLALLEISTVKM